MNSVYDVTWYVLVYIAGSVSSVYAVKHQSIVVAYELNCASKYFTSFFVFVFFAPLRRVFLPGCLSHIIRGTGTTFVYLPGTSVSSVGLPYRTRNFCDIHTRTRNLYVRGNISGVRVCSFKRTRVRVRVRVQHSCPYIPGTSVSSVRLLPEYRVTILQWVPCTRKFSRFPGTAGEHWTSSR